MVVLPLLHIGDHVNGRSERVWAAITDMEVYFMAAMLTVIIFTG